MTQPGMWDALIADKARWVGGTLTETDKFDGRTVTTTLRDIRWLDADECAIEFVGADYTAYCDREYIGVRCREKPPGHPPDGLTFDSLFGRTWTITPAVQP